MSAVGERLLALGRRKSCSYEDVRSAPRTNTRGRAESTGTYQPKLHFGCKESLRVAGTTFQYKLANVPCSNKNYG